VDWAALTEAGLYDPAAPNAPDRKALLEFLAEQGCTLDEMVAADAKGRLFGLAGDRLIRPGREEFTLREAAAEAQASVDLVARLWQAYGLPIVDPDTKVATRDDVDVLPLFVTIAGVVGEDAALGLARVLGASVARFADAISAALRTTVSDLAIDTSGSELATAQAFAAIASVTPAVGKALDVVFRHHLESARRQFEQSGSNDVALLGQIRLAVGFADVSGFTALSSAATSAELSRLLTDFEYVATTVVHEHGGRVVKFIGDAVMYVCTTADAAVDAATRLVERSTAPVRAGLSYGLLLAQDGDYFGPPVNLAARLAAVAEPRQVLVSDDLQQRLTNGRETTALPPQELRGIADPVVAYAVR
jgi:class 3 adenylate cyclase